MLPRLVTGQGARRDAAPESRTHRVSEAPKQPIRAPPTTDEVLAMINSEIQNSLVAFAFNDPISQPLSNVTSASRIDEPTAWQQPKNTIKQSQAMESERSMFEHIRQGANDDEALKIYRHHFDDQPVTVDSNDDIELF
jgi:hypothetical protein